MTRVTELVSPLADALAERLDFQRTTRPAHQLGRPAIHLQPVECASGQSFSVLTVPARGSDPGVLVKGIDGITALKVYARLDPQESGGSGGAMRRYSVGVGGKWLRISAVASR